MLFIPGSEGLRVRDHGAGPGFCQRNVVSARSRMVARSGVGGRATSAPPWQSLLVSLSSGGRNVVAEAESGGAPGASIYSRTPPFLLASVGQNASGSGVVVPRSSVLHSTRWLISPSRCGRKRGCGAESGRSRAAPQGPDLLQDSTFSGTQRGAECMCQRSPCGPEPSASRWPF